MPDPANATQPLRGRCDAARRLLSADSALETAQRGCGGEMPGTLAIPELLELVAGAMVLGSSMARKFTVRHDRGILRGRFVCEPYADGCAIAVHDWDDAEEDCAEETRTAVEALLAEATVLLDTDKRILALEGSARGLPAERIREARGRPWHRVFQRPDGENTPMLAAPLTCEGASDGWLATLVEGAGGYRLLLRRDPKGRAAGHDSDLLDDDLLSEQLLPAMAAPVREMMAQATIVADRLAGPLADEYAKYGQDILAAGRHLNALAEGLAQSQAAASATPEAEPVDLRATAAEAARMLDPRVRDRGVRITLDERGANAFADPRLTMQILLNLIGNAVAYGRENGRIAIGLSRHADRVSVTVADDGDGIAAADQVRLFDKFERLGRSGDGGSGLGLHIARSLARSMGGDLTVRSKPGEGAAFTLTLPAA